LRIGGLTVDTHLVRFYTGGDFYDQMPQVMRDLPVDLLRSRQYPRNPEVLERGLEQLQHGKRPVFYAPQAMGLTRWKTPPTRTAWGQNVTSLLSAMHHNLQVQHQARVHQVPVMDAIEAGRAVGADRMPMPTDNMDPNLREGYVPLASGAVPRNRLVDMNQLSQAHAAVAAVEMKSDARRAALQEVGAYSDRLAMMALASSGVPWFVR